MAKHDRDRLNARQDLANEVLWTEVSQMVRTFRRGIDEVAGEGDLPWVLMDFPNGRCGVISTVLGHYLNVRYGLQIEQVWADRDGKLHSWLEIFGLAIDITGDQFEGRPPVFYGERDQWFTSWEEDRDLRGIAILDVHQPTYAAEFEAQDRIIQRSALSMIDH